MNVVMKLKILLREAKERIYVYIIMVIPYNTGIHICSI